MILLIFVIIIVAILSWKMYENMYENGDVNKKISVTVGEKRLGDFPSEKAGIETKVSSCNAALTQITQGTQAIKDQFLKKKNDEFKTCQLKVGKALDVYKRTFREVTGADLTEEQIRRLKKENGIDF